MSSDVQAKWINSARRGDLRVAGEALAQPVLDRLHVVVGGGLDRLDALGVGEREAADGARRARARGRGARTAQRGERRLGGERLQPFDLDAHARADQRELAEMVLQRAGSWRRSGRRGEKGR